MKHVDGDDGHICHLYYAFTITVYAPGENNVALVIEEQKIFISHIFVILFPVTS
jgi:hypothetical protein